MAISPSDGTVELVPAYLEVTLDKPGETKQIQLFLTNHTQKQITLQLFPIDFKQQEPNGITTFIGQQEKNYSYSLASFLSFETDTVVIDPGQKQPVTIQVANRKDVSPGGHYAAVVAKLVTENQDKSSTTYLAPAVSSLIYLRKTGGEKFSLGLKDVSWPQNAVAFQYPQSLQLSFQNEGNVHVIPYGLIQITDNFHRVIYKGIINTSSARILPETRRDIDVSLVRQKNSWPISFNTVSVQGHDSLNKLQYTYRRNFIYINPILFILIPIVLFFVIPKIWKKKRKHET